MPPRPASPTASRCDAVGIQYQQGLKDLLPASDLAEGLLNNDDRPEVKNEAGQPIRPGKAITHFNEVDECAAIDGLLTDQVHRALGQPAENTLHDLRWGDVDATGKQDGFIWVFEISGAAPAAHHAGGYAGSQGFRQPAMYFPFGGSTLSGVAKPGVVVWSRFYVADDQLQSRYRPGRRASSWTMRRPAGGSTQRRRCGRSCTGGCAAFRRPR